MIKDPFGESNLSDQESMVLRLAADGMTDREIAKRMQVSEKTVDTYWSRIRQKLDARNRTHAVAIAFKDAYENRHDPLFGCDEMLSTSEEGVWIIDMRANTVYANQKTAALFRVTPEEMLRTNAWDMLDEEGRAEARKMNGQFPNGRQDSFRLTFKRHDGSDVRLILTTTPIHDEKGCHIRSMMMLNEEP